MVELNKFADTSSLNFEPGSWQETVYDIFLGIYIGAAYICYFVKQFFWNNLLVPVFGLAGIVVDNESDDQQMSFSDDNELKVIGVGYGRTGTYSLTLALEKLGFPCLHTMHMYERSSILDMWAQKIFLPSIENGHAELGKPDFGLIAAHGIQATADFPTALYFEQIHQEYPNCKFILTTRDNSEVWFRSWDTMTKSITQPTHIGGIFVPSVHQYSNYLRWLFSMINSDDSYLTASLPLPPQNKKESIASYEEHNRRVREVIPPELLLEYNVKDGWEPLCSFLEIDPCPTSQPFPKSNSATSMQAQGVSSFAFPLAVILFIVFYAFAMGFQRMTGMTVLGWLHWRISDLVQHILKGVAPVTTTTTGRRGKKRA